MSADHAVTVYLPEALYRQLAVEAKAQHATLGEAIVAHLQQVPRFKRPRPHVQRAVPAFGALLAALREEHGWTRGDLARRTSLTASGIWRLEAGERSPLWATVRLLAQGLGLSPAARREFYQAAGFHYAEDVA